MLSINETSKKNYNNSEKRFSIENEIQKRGSGELIGWRDPDENREWIKNNKSRSLVDKITDVKEAVSKYILDNSFISMGGFGHVRVSMAIIYEIIRQKKLCPCCLPDIDLSYKRLRECGDGLQGLGIGKDPDELSVPFHLHQSGHGKFLEVV